MIMHSAVSNIKRKTLLEPNENGYISATLRVLCHNLSLAGYECQLEVSKDERGRQETPSLILTGLNPSDCTNEGR